MCTAVPTLTFFCELRLSYVQGRHLDSLRPLPSTPTSFLVERNEHVLETEGLPSCYGNMEIAEGQCHVAWLVWTNFPV